ncbi:uncharacterized protein LOC126907760 [Daktulosphaira vitifoliae]|uniref:uncharacterized protein LOC126907760 n=1 Tax=Daktulosphaira vitifoliae TaxID=58002 RepID=UPI0021A9C556|nr:uncharacterized protein LOC126907760 [Daktulosphaira vitifoliae]
MYAVKTPSKYMSAKTRRGVRHSFDRLDSFRENLKKGNGTEEEELPLPEPKPVFHSNSHRKSFHKNHSSLPDVLSPQHEKLIQYINDSWHSVVDIEESLENSKKIVYFQPQNTTDILNDFQAFDLETYWIKRLYNNITKSVP